MESEAKDTNPKIVRRESNRGTSEATDWSEPPTVRGTRDWKRLGRGRFRGGGCRRRCVRRSFHIRWRRAAARSSLRRLLPNPFASEDGSSRSHSVKRERGRLSWLWCEENLSGKGSREGFGVIWRGNGGQFGPPRGSLPPEAKKRQDYRKEREKAK